MTSVRARPYLILAAALAAALLVAGCGGGGETTTVIERTVTERAPAEEAPPAESAGDRGDGAASPAGAAGSEAPSRVRRLPSFRSPTGNIGCMLAGGLARCDIGDRKWTAPRPAGCPEQVDYGQGLEVGRSGPGAVVCAGDTARDPSAAVLAYGTAASAGPFVCVSRRDGITCSNARNGHGFFISAQRYRTF